jgi:Spy/CpxP family protein refolding chaperone
MSSFSSAMPFKRFFLRAVVKPMAAAVLLAGVAAMSAGAVAQPDAMAHDGSAAMTSHGSEDIAAHVNGMLQYIYAEVGATDTQKAKLSTIVQQATSDLAPLQEKLQSSHERLFGLLTQGSIDRNAVEAERASHLSVANQASKRATQFFIDVAEALTPQQRKALAEHMNHHAG